VSSDKLAHLEEFYDYLAESIDQVDSEKQALFLTKICLLNFDALGDLDLAKRNVKAALENL